ncbi:MAG: Unknown protein [uncultured Sulfurovum sp.]|uniref:Uncharacterized protein n=1 Tax=uncultured Sulfurovum sp. TaxID=269237 RepID=A0A6S6TQC1_9BACT|nr:MAG: Unknown protein [uncultured Sulfurovum sp.]
MSNETKKWYQSVPDLLKALAVVITAITGLIIAIDKPSDNKETPPKEPSAQTSVFDGKYQGIRGYTDDDRRSPLNYCLKRYAFNATIENNKLTFKSDNRTFTGEVNSKGVVFINETDIWPQPKQGLIITGAIENAKMTSEYCGNGYFRLYKEK